MAAQQQSYQASPENVAILAAAAVMAGDRDEGWHERYVLAARELKLSTRDTRNEALRVLMDFDGVAADGTSMDLKHFVGTVLGIRKEESSKRGVVALWTGHQQKPRPNPLTGRAMEGVEYVRTDRTDFSVAARAFANSVRGLVGHKVLVTVKMEPMTTGNGQKARVIIHAQDLGTTDEMAAAPMVGHAFDADFGQPG